VCCKGQHFQAPTLSGWWSGKAKVRLGDGAGLPCHLSNRLKRAAGAAPNKDTAMPRQ